MNKSIDLPDKTHNNGVDRKNYVLEKYEQKIGYYWKAGSTNKKAYKLMRYLIVFLGALTTFIASISSASFIRDNMNLNVVFALATPILVAMLSIVGGFSQTFQWGAAWHEMVLTAENLEKEYDRIHVTPPEELNAIADLELLNNKIIDESDGFFSRIVGGTGVEKKSIKSKSARQ